MSGDNMSLTITLIHGTWGRGLVPRIRATRPRWFERGSQFRSDLEYELKRKRFNYEIIEFPWTGSNSIVERDSAARELASRLRDKLGNSRHNLLIAHSHGGNVALRALNCLEDSAVTSPVWVATMATPFVQIKAVKERDISQFFLGLSLALTLPLINIAALHFEEIQTGAPFLIAPFTLFDQSANASLRLLGWVVATIYAMTIFSIFHKCSQVIVGILFKGSAGRADQLFLAAYYDFTNKLRHRLLVLRGTDDEANAILTLGGFGAYLVQSLIENNIGRILTFGVLINAPIVISVFSFLVYQLFEYAVYGTRESISASQWLYQNATNLYRSVWALAGRTVVVSSVVLASAQLLRGVFGRELLGRSMLCEVIAHSTPDYAEGMEVVTLSGGPRQGFKHKLYDDRRCVSEIVSWLASSISSPNAVRRQ
jgi:hypothetical protein